MGNNKGSSALEVAVSFLVGAATGFILGILFAPASGKETRKKFKETAVKTGEVAKEGYEKIAREAEKGIKIVREKTQEGMDAIKEFIEKKKGESQKKTPQEFPGEEETKT